MLCTDGLANMGVGQLEDIDGEVNAKLFYTELGERARLHGLTVNIISLIGAECRLEALTAVTEQSRGSVERVAATQLQNELRYGTDLYETQRIHQLLHFFILL